MLWCTGTSADKRSNIHFRLTINRKARPSADISTVIHGHFTFDTLATRFLQTSGSSYAMTFSVDSLIDNRIKGRFSGTAKDVTDISGAPKNITAGKFSFVFGAGTSEPKFFSFQDNEYRSGFFKNARLITNSIVLEGLAFAYAPDQRFRMVVRTGGTIKPGIYKSSKGEAGMYFFTPSLYKHYINDSLGDLTVTITAVNGSVVHGSFSGTGSGAITNGKFSCRIKDYQPQTELPDRWQFSFDEAATEYNCYAGNVLNVQQSQSGGRYLLTVNGESDHGASVYKLVLSSSAPLSTGIYRSMSGASANRLDSAHFKSATQLWNGTTYHFYTGSSIDTWCRIDTLDATHVVGRLFGRLRMNYSTSGISSFDVKLGDFRGRF
jgi:hypothetical protein